MQQAVEAAIKRAATEAAKAVAVAAGAASESP